MELKPQRATAAIPVDLVLIVPFMELKLGKSLVKSNVCVS